MIHTDEDDEFERIANEAKLKGQPYHFKPAKYDDDDIQDYVRPWRGLTDEEIAECAERMEASDPTDSFWREFAQAIETKLKEKNR
jgi:hypothetical protein